MEGKEEEVEGKEEGVVEDEQGQHVKFHQPSF